MGDCTPMKKLIFLPLFFSVIVLAGNDINSPMVAPTTDNVIVMDSQNDKELAWVDEQIRAILPARIGVSDGYINSLIDPIKYATPITTPKVGGGGLLPPPRIGSTLLSPVIPKVVIEPLRLQALMNKSALINGKWYKIGDSVRNYSLSEIKAASILLRATKGEPLVLFLSKNNNNIKINTK